MNLTLDMLRMPLKRLGWQWDFPGVLTFQIGGGAQLCIGTAQPNDWISLVYQSHPGAQDEPILDFAQDCSVAAAVIVAGAFAREVRAAFVDGRPSILLR